jgi:glutamate N-acetyltransferase / amino-acid N-acetyltransferase
MPPLVLSRPLCPLPQGFRVAGVHCGVKPGTDRRDLALYVSDSPAASAGVFTTNLVNGAPVKLSRRRVGRATTRAVVMNSGNSNACTGERGLADAETMTAGVANLLGCAADDVLVCSTGVIGRFLPLDRIAAGLPTVHSALAASEQALDDAARAIMTTDTFPKVATRLVSLTGGAVRVTGVCKGAAMIAPNMATMLAVLLTDARMTPSQTDAAVRQAVGQSFNCISVDGHMSTSDTVLLLANGASGVEATTAADHAALQTAIDEVAAELARLIIADGEGADHEITIDITGLRTRDEAFRIAKSIAESPLVKTAIHGADPNWGRIISAAGYAGVPLVDANMTLHVNGFELYRDGAPLPFDTKAVSASLRDNRQVQIDLKFNLGDASVRFWTCDLTAEYVRLNADYTT